MRSFWPRAPSDPGFDGRATCCLAVPSFDAGYTAEHASSSRSACATASRRLPSRERQLLGPHPARLRHGPLERPRDEATSPPGREHGRQPQPRRARTSALCASPPRWPRVHLHDGRHRRAGHRGQPDFRAPVFGSANPVGRKVRDLESGAPSPAWPRRQNTTPCPKPRAVLLVPLNSRTPTIPSTLRPHRGQPDDALKALRRDAAAIDPEVGAFEAMPPPTTSPPPCSAEVAASLLGVARSVVLLLAAVASRASRPVESGLATQAAGEAGHYGLDASGVKPYFYDAQCSGGPPPPGERALGDETALSATCLGISYMPRHRRSPYAAAASGSADGTARARDAGAGAPATCGGNRSGQERVERPAVTKRMRLSPTAPYTVHRREARGDACDAQRPSGGCRATAPGSASVEPSPVGTREGRCRGHPGHRRGSENGRGGS